MDTWEKKNASLWYSYLFSSDSILVTDWQYCEKNEKKNTVGYAVIQAFFFMPVKVENLYSIDHY